METFLVSRAETAPWVAAVVRYHNRKSQPAGHHVAYASLG